MKKTAMLFVVGIIALLIAGCATTEGYKQICDAWLGYNINQLVEGRGYPTSTFKAPNGNTVYEYTSERYSTKSTRTQYYKIGDRVHSVTTGGGTKRYWCTTFFEVDDDNVIIKYRFEGNSCRAVPPK